ncbi:MAG: superoxide dismutase [Ni] [Planctomycetota bacterium]|nr:superoxide dismutase [Ni] [Planctomycetota bacterium]
MKKKTNKKLALSAAIVSAIVFGSLAYSHCQVPCGIYGDDTRFDLIGEHITTIEKSMKQIEEVMAQDPPNANQIVRWVNNKEKHADEISHIVTYYFMAQRVKIPPAGDAKANSAYVKKLTLLHQMLVYSMKAKQTTDLSNVHQLRHLLEDFHKAYAG